MQVLQLLFVLLADLQLVRMSRVVHAPLGVVDPALDLGWRKVIDPTGLRNRCLPLNNIDLQRRLTLGRPAFDDVVHLHTHRYRLLCSMSRSSLARYT